jgi:sugar phosphate isomerase/epimerase
MQIGWCAPLAKAASLEKLGYDYIEVPLAAFGLEDAASVQAAVKALAGSPLPTPAFGYFLPRDMQVVGPTVDIPRVRNYLSHAAELMALSKGKVVAFGSGWARTAPPDWHPARTEQQLLEFLSLAADAFAGSGARVAIEPQNRKEAGTINHLHEAERLARMVNRPEIGLMADFYHMDEEGDPLRSLSELNGLLVHMHTADTQRLNPGSGQYDYASLLNSLRSGGYGGRLSVECMVEIPESEMRRSLAFLGERCTQAGL